MLAYVISIGAFIALTVHVIALLLLLHGRGTNVDTEKLVDTVRRLVRNGERCRAVDEVARIESRNPARQLLLFMLSLELPARASIKAPSAGYRDAPMVAVFDDAVRMRVDAEDDDLRGDLVTPSIGAIASGPVAAILCLFALVHGANFWRVSSMCGMTFGFIGTVTSISVVRGLYRGLNEARASISALTQPIEQMDEDAKNAASRARGELGLFSGLSAAPVATGVGFVLLVWIGAAFMASK